MTDTTSPRTSYPDTPPLPVWWIVDLPGGEMAVELLGGMLMDLGAKGMTPVGDRLQASFLASEDKEGMMDTITEAVEALHADGLLPDTRVTARLAEDEDWVGRWRRSLGPIRVGEHFVIVPPGVEFESSPGDRVLAIEPRMAFGTGEHATTKQILAAVERLPMEGARVLDLGCGNGVLALGALLAGAEQVTAVDFEPESVEETADNARRHDLTDRVDVIAADVLDWQPEQVPYDVLLANIYITPILAGVQRWTRWVKPGGHVAFTGVRAVGELDELKEVVARAGIELLGESAEDGWACVWGRVPG